MRDPPTPSPTASAAPKSVATAGVGRRLALNVVLFSLLVAVVLSALQTWIERRAELRLLEQRVEQILESTGSALALSVWNLDRSQVDVLLRGILSLPDVRAVELRAQQGQVFFDDGDRQRALRIGDPSVHSALVWERPISFQRGGSAVQLAQLRIEFDTAAVESRLLQRALRSALAQIALTLLIALFLLWVVNNLVTRHLVRLADAASRYDVRNADVSFRIERRKTGGAHDEIDRVVGALEAMRTNLETAYRDLARVNTELQVDIHARELAESAAAFMARHDALTALPNRRFLIESLQRQLDANRDGDSHGALLFIDLDNFKNLNDARGHSTGDAVLIELSQRLSREMPEGSLIARMGGDEFVAMLVGLEGSPGVAAARARAFGEGLREIIGEPVQVLGEAFRLSASIGIAMFPTDGDDIETLIRHADSAMYQAKADGRNLVQLFQPALVSRIEYRHAMDADLREAIDLHQLNLHYQPIVDPDGRFVGAEALLRWQHPRRGAVSPAEFIPLCEQSGLIIAIGEWVIAEALSTLVRWQSMGLLGDLHYLSINISPRQFKQADFVERLTARLEDSGVEARRLALEITEGAVIDDSEDAICNLQRLRTAGFRLLVDDFGVGYSSLSYLKRLPVHAIKIDQSFVRDITTDPNDAALVEAMLAIGQRFGLDVIAEGVETADQFGLLRERGCQLFQGYFFGRPQTAAELELRWLQVAASTLRDG
ncbi:putative bifunctional diguanylate cyclase/phosphodiesterase [Aquimonas sp.]|jgi:diguanylate cyclase (GGDEF)-like protein|uniref:putative bifunctional diguanylate cyclase/phosphodiesterase n=1 Tax=Aquimonas sp. TaxID=1872588 RepID=UPI0037BF9108